MQQWEYLVGSSRYNRESESWKTTLGGDEVGSVEEMLAKAGDAEYELVGVSPQVGSSTDDVTAKVLVRTNAEYFYFKRRKAEPTPS